MKIAKLLFLCLFLTGCTSVRYQLGYRAGIKAYEKGKKTGYVKKGYALGYINGFNLMHSLDALEESSKRLSDAMKELENIGKRQNERMRQLGVTDEQIDKSLQDALDEAEKRTDEQMQNTEKIKK